MASFHFNTAASRNARRVWYDFIEEKFGVSSVTLGDETGFSGDIRCSSLGFLTLAQIKATHQLGERNRAQVASGTSRSTKSPSATASPTRPISATRSGIITAARRARCGARRAAAIASEAAHAGD